MRGGRLWRQDTRRACKEQDLTSPLIHHQILEDLKIMAEFDIIVSPYTLSTRQKLNKAADTEECPLSEHYEVSGGTRLGEGSVPEGARFRCLRPPGRVRKVERPSLRTGQKLSSESEGGILQEGFGSE
jgi:hypothetical protein